MLSRIHSFQSIAFCRTSNSPARHGYVPYKFRIHATAGVSGSSARVPTRTTCNETPRPENNSHPPPFMQIHPQALVPLPHLLSQLKRMRD